MFTEATNFTEAVVSFASYIATALPVNSVNVNTPAKKIMYHPWILGGLNPSFFVIWGGLAPPSPCVEPPLSSPSTQPALLDHHPVSPSLAPRSLLISCSPTEP